MSSVPSVRFSRMLFLLPTALLALGCASDDTPLAPDTELIPMCLAAPNRDAAISVPASEVAAYRQRGAYATRLEVSKGAITTRDSLHFARITDALAAARAGRLARGEQQTALCPITIAVDSGVYRGDVSTNADATVERFPLVIDAPAITLRGALTMQRDATGRATGLGADGKASTLQPVIPLPISGGSSQTGSSTPLIIINGVPGGSSGSGATIEGFVLQSGHVGIDTVPGGQGVFSLRVENLTVRGNRFEAGFTEAVDLRASSATVVANHLAGSAGTCDICIAGPGVYRVADNRLLAGGIPGILAVPALVLPVSALVTQFTPPTDAMIIATVANNDIRNHLRKPVGVGIRVGAVGVGAPNVTGTSRVEIIDNTLVNNTFGIILEAAFPVANSALRGDLQVTLQRNTVTQSCQRDLLVSLSRHTTALGLANAAFLRGSSYLLTLDNSVRWDDAWFSHPANLGNSLLVNGQPIANGARAAYDVTRTCAPLP